METAASTAHVVDGTEEERIASLEALAAARRHGQVSYALAPRFEDLLREIAAGTPVIVLQNLGLFTDTWHYAVAIGFDYPRGTLVLRSGTQEREVMPFAAHEVVWMRSGYWAMVAVPPDRIPATAEEKSWLSAIAALERTGQARTQPADDAGPRRGAELLTHPAFRRRLAPRAFDGSIDRLEQQPAAAVEMHAVHSGHVDPVQHDLRVPIGLVMHQFFRFELFHHIRYGSGSAAKFFGQFIRGYGIIFAL